MSGFEYELVKRLNVAAADIIFNGPIKSQSEISEAVVDGAIINIDSVEELVRVEKIAQVTECVAKLGVRLNFSEALDSPSRFGIEANSIAVECIEKIRKSQSLEFMGLHAHYCFSAKNVCNF